MVPSEEPLAVFRVSSTVGKSVTILNPNKGEGQPVVDLKKKKKRTNARQRVCVKSCNFIHLQVEELAQITV